MPIRKTDIEGLFIYEPRIFPDSRGYFFESYNRAAFAEAGIDIVFVQDNEAKSEYGVIRGLHYQLAPNAQAKLVRASEGKILDVAVDIRKGSPTYGKSFSIELSAENHKQVLVPKGFAHGYSVLSETAVVMYKCDEFYNPAFERGIPFNDPALNIDWQVPAGKESISEKDQKHLPFAEAENNFSF